MEASHKKHRPHIKVGKDAKEEEYKYLVPVKTIDQTFEIHTGFHVCVEQKHVIKGSRTMTHVRGPASTLTIRVLDMDTITCSV